MKELTQEDVLRRSAALVDPSGFEGDLDLGELANEYVELASLYQTIKETRIDLILVDGRRTDLTRAVATRIRRYNGLTEIWRLTQDDLEIEPLPDYFDGAISADLGERGVYERMKQILRTKRLLTEFGIVARSSRMRAVAETIERIAPTDMATLIVGPSGSGKELAARAVHAASERSQHPFVAINCGALAEGLLESELFGHEKGAFTGSVSKREGLFHKAGQGTIFLDEIGEMKPDMQVKLLRVLEDGAYYPVGSSVARQAQARVVSATNRDLSDAIADHAFREDLFYRIAVVRIDLPSLLDRKGDIQPLLQFFWNGGQELTYSDSALSRLQQYDWPGNIRQLKNFADRMMALKGKGLVEVSDVDGFLEEQRSTAKHLPVSTGKTVEEAGQELIYRAILSLGNEVRLLRDLILANIPSEEAHGEVPAGEADIGPAMTMEEMEERMIKKTLAETGHNRKETARRLGIGERTLYRKLKKYDLN